MSEWTTYRLGDVCSKIGSGATPRGGSGVYLEQGEYALIRSQNIYNEGFHHDGLAYLTQKHADELSNVEVQSGDVLLNITGDSVARSCQVDTDILPARVNQHVAIIRPDPKKLAPRFLRYYLVSPAMQSHMLSLAGAGATRNALTKGMIEAFELVGPSDLGEQQAIACILGALDDKIELNRRRNRTLEAMARAIFQSWFVDFDPVRAKAEGRKPAGLSKELAALFPKEFEESDLGDIPKGWRERPLPEVFDVNPTRSLSKGTLAPYLDMANMPTQGPSPDTWVTREMGSGTKFINGDTLVARITPCLENGKTALVDFLPDGQVGWGSTEYIVLRPKGTIPPAFAYLLARGESFRTFAIQQMTGSSGRQRVPADSLSKYEIVAPEVESPIFQRFERIVSPMFAQITASVTQSRTLAALRDALLPKLISGELRVPDAERIVGRVM
ncbi:MAG: restriction endonuclease subunit S [Bacteroidales bacterium]|nr:restriction endonuclease subunit S [Bacteroidales bacterium]